MNDLKIAQLEPLSLEEESERLSLEKKVERAFYEAGLALQSLRDRRLWRSTHYSFKEYCHDRFGFSKSQSYRLIDAIEIGKNLYGEVPNWGLNKTIVLATAESQLRPLKRLKEPELQRSAWQKAVEKAGQKVPTAALVKEIVNQIQPQKVRQVSPQLAHQSTDSQAEYLPLTKASIGQKIRIKAYHALFSLQLGVIVQIPNNRSVIVELENRARELIDLKDLEIQRIVSSNGQITTPTEGPNRIAGMGLDWYVRVDEETFKALDNYAKKAGIATLGLAISRLVKESSYL
jgi:hypothetical protein